MSETLALTKALVDRPSVTPEDGDCQVLLADRLAKSGFTATHLPFGNVKNIWLRRGDAKPLFVFVGHTDVVPTGPVEQWMFSPFTATEYKDYLYGRGTQDMKSNIAAMVTACERFVQQHPKHKGSIALLLTSDEEGPSIDGTVKVVEHLQQQGVHIDWCIVGEPSSQKIVGDMLKIGRRGSLSASLKIHGKQGHIAYPHLADNPIHTALPALTQLIQTEWDKTHEFFQATSLQISNIHSGTGANNVIPGHLDLLCNFRYSPNVTAENLQSRFEAILKQANLNYDIQWHHSGKPFLTTKGKLLEACVATIKKETGVTPELSTNGGTSDGRFVAATGAEVVELGVGNDTIHQINERVKISELDLLSKIYENILEDLLA